MKLTRIDGVPDSDSVVPGMAHFAGSGPYGKTCGDCRHRGYEREKKRGKWDETLRQYVSEWYRYLGCAKFKQLTGTSGPVIRSDNRSCKYFEAQE